MKNTIEDPEKLANKIDESDKKTIKDALKEAQEWLEANSNAEKEDYDEQLKELEGICNPIVSKAYSQGGGGSGGAGGSNYDDVNEDL